MKKWLNFLALEMFFVHFVLGTTHQTYYCGGIFCGERWKNEICQVFYNQTQSRNKCIDFRSCYKRCSTRVGIEKCGCARANSVNKTDWIQEVKNHTLKSLRCWKGNKLIWCPSTRRHRARCFYDSGVRGCINEKDYCEELFCCCDVERCNSDSHKCSISPPYTKYPRLSTTTTKYPISLTTGKYFNSSTAMDFFNSSMNASLAAEHPKLSSHHAGLIIAVALVVIVVISIPIIAMVAKANRGH